MHTVLLIDRDSDTREILELVLGAAGYRVIHAVEATAGLLLARTSEPAVVVTEFMVDNRCVVEELRGDALTATVPCVVLTTSVFPETRKRVLEATAMFVAKPTTPRRVAELVALMATSGAVAPRMDPATPARRWPHPA